MAVSDIVNMGLNPKIIIAHDPIEFARMGADIFVLSAKEALQRNGQFNVAIPGGDTPAPIYKLFAMDEYCSQIPWKEMHIFWVDERCVPVVNAASNYGRALKDFIGAVPISSAHVHNMPVDIPPKQGAATYELDLIDFFRLKRGEFPVFDLIFLGVGSDGHIASLFQGSSALKEKDKMVLPVKGGDPEIDRLTLTLPVLNNAKKIVFLVAGKGKARIVNELLNRKQIKLPAQLIKPVKGDVMWLLDRDAVSLKNSNF
jgi:6-phosphogluconolactonase